MERLRGVPLTDLDAVRRATSADPESVLISALNVWGASVLGAETFHAAAKVTMAKTSVTAQQAESEGSSSGRAVAPP